MPHRVIDVSPSVFQCPRGLGDFSHRSMTRSWPRWYGNTFQCPRGLGDFSHQLKALGCQFIGPTGGSFQCPRGLGDFSHFSAWPGKIIAWAGDRFNAREGLVTFPTFPQLRFSAWYQKSFNAREGLVTFPTEKRNRRWLRCFWFQCPRGLGDFSHRPPQPRRPLLRLRQCQVSMPARAW